MPEGGQRKSFSKRLFVPENTAYFSKHAVSCSHQRAPVLSRQTTISYSRSELASRDVHGQILDEQLSARSSGEGSSAENENVFLLEEVPDQLYLG